MLLGFSWLNAEAEAAQGPDQTRAERSWATVSGPARDVRFEPLTRADGIPPNSFYQVAHDQRGFLWFTTQNGLVRYDGYEHVRYPGLPLIRKTRSEAEPGLLHQDRNGNLWIGTNALTRFDPATGTFVEVLKPQAGTEGNELEAITAIEDGPNGTLWLRFDPRTGRYRQLTKLSYRITSMLEDSTGRFWVGAQLTPVQLVDRKTGAVTPMSILGGYLTYEDRAGNIWFGFAPGFSRLDRRGDVRLVPLARSDSRNESALLPVSMHEDAEGLLWVATVRGLYPFDPRKEKAEFYGTEQGLPTNYTACLLPDGNGNLWMANAQGISRFDLREKRFYNYDERDGLQGRSFNMACYAARDGTLYFGGSAGFNAFRPRDILSRPPEPRLVLTRLQVNGKDLASRNLDFGRLSHRQNNGANSPSIAFRTPRVCSDSRHGIRILARATMCFAPRRPPTAGRGTARVAYSGSRFCALGGGPGGRRAWKRWQRGARRRKGGGRPPGAPARPLRCHPTLARGVGDDPNAGVG